VPVLGLIAKYNWKVAGGGNKGESRKQGDIPHYIVPPTGKSKKNTGKITQVSSTAKFSGEN